MAVSDFLGDMGVNIASDSAIRSGSVFQGLIIFILVAILAGVITYYFVNKKAYNLKIHIWEDINGVTAPKGEDVAKEVTLPFTSVRAFYLKKSKIFLPRGSIQFGKNHYIYYVRKDGEWNNVGIGSLNKQLTELKLIFDHTDMRMANASLKKLVEKNYKKLNWLKEYAPYIGFGILILMLGIAGYMIFSEAGKNLGAMSGIADNLARVTEHVERLLGTTDVVTSNSGIRMGA